jgi:ketopantoate reductase
MLSDVKSRRVTEIDATSGFLIRRAKGHGLSVPYMESIYFAIRVKEQNFGNEV